MRRRPRAGPAFDALYKSKKATCNAQLDLQEIYESDGFEDNGFVRVGDLVCYSGSDLEADGVMFPPSRDSVFSFVFPMVRYRELAMKSPKWFYERLELPTDAKVGDFLQLGSRGPVVIYNRVFDQQEPIDLDLGLFQIEREKGSRFLKVKTGLGEEYLFEFRAKLFATSYWLKWSPEAVSPAGDLVPFPLPRITWKGGLFWRDVWDELGGFIVASIVLYVVGALAISVLGGMLGTFFK